MKMVKEPDRMIPKCLSFQSHPGHRLVGFDRVGDAKDNLSCCHCY
jgi:hypothetical protein